MVVRLDSSAIDEVCRLENECFGEEAWSRNSVSEEFSNTFSTFFAYSVGKVVAGYIGVRCVENELQFLNVAVSPRFRRMGIGTVLVRQALLFGAENGCQVAELEVSVNNAAAIALYRKCGFSVAGVRRGFYPHKSPSKDAYTMTAPLT